MRQFGSKVGNKIKEEQASVFLTAVLFITFVSTILVSTAYYSSKHFAQLQQVSSAYMAKSMIEVSEHLLLADHSQDVRDKKMTIHFNQGRVTSHPVGENSLVLVSFLNDGFTSQRTIRLKNVDNKIGDGQAESEQDLEDVDDIQKNETEEERIEESEAIETEEKSN